MVNDNILVKDRYRIVKKILLFIIILSLIVIVLAVVFFSGSLFGGKKTEFILENPMKNIIITNTDSQGKINYEKSISEGVLEFNENYINYLLAAMGVGNLHSSIVYGNPGVEFILGEEVWNSELSSGKLISSKGPGENEDIRIRISKEEAVKALLSEDVVAFMKSSVTAGETKVEMVAGKVELASKGYLAMYQDLTGEEIEVDEESLEEAYP